MPQILLFKINDFAVKLDPKQKKMKAHSPNYSGKFFRPSAGMMCVVLGAACFGLSSPCRGMVRIVAVVVKQLLPCTDPLFREYADPVISCYHYDFSIAVWVRGVVRKFQFIALTVRIKNKLHSKC